MPKRVFNPAEHMISRDRVFNKHTMRWEGNLVDFTTDDLPVEDDPEPVVAKLRKDEMVEIARDAGLKGYSQMDRGELEAFLIEEDKIEAPDGQE